MSCVSNFSAIVQLVQKLLFEVRYHFGWPGGGQNGQNCSNFIKEYPVGSSRKEKIQTKIGGKLDMLQATFWLFF